MSIVSEALKKAARTKKLKDVSNRSIGRREIIFIKKRLRRRNYRILRASAFVVLSAIALAGLLFYALNSNTNVLKVSSAPAVSGPVPAEKTAKDERGLGSFSVEEKAFHKVGTLSAQVGDPLFILTGIARNEDGFMAVINDEILKIGDVVQGALVTDITINYVELQINNEIILLEKYQSENSL
jgi:hypothetical protein